MRAASVIVFAAASTPILVRFLLMMFDAQRLQIVEFVRQLWMFDDAFNVVDLHCGPATTGPLAVGLIIELNLA